MGLINKTSPLHTLSQSDHTTSDLSMIEQTQWVAEVSRRFMDIINKNWDVNAALNDFLSETKKLVNCDTGSILIIDDTGKTEYQAGNTMPIKDRELKCKGILLLHNQP